MTSNKLFVRLSVDRRLGLSALPKGPARQAAAGASLPFGGARIGAAASNRPELFPLRRQVREPRAARAREVRSAVAGGHGDEHLRGPPI